jgi:hypothetical protein
LAPKAFGRRITLDTKIKTDLFAKQLRAQLTELKESRAVELAAYHDAVRQWRLDLAQWRLDLAQWIQEHGGKHDFFRGSPLPPEYPDGKAIREIQPLLRQLGITGQATITVSTADVARLLEGAPLSD